MFSFYCEEFLWWFFWFIDFGGLKLDDVVIFVNGLKVFCFTFVVDSKFLIFFILLFIRKTFRSFILLNNTDILWS